MAGTRRVAVVGTGGTIAFKAGHPLDVVEYFDTGQMVSVEELARKIDKFGDKIDVVPLEFDTLPSDAIGPTHWLKLNRFLDQIAKTHVLDGIVVTHGTSTIEETAYFLNLVVKTDKPLVLVGAQRPLNAVGSDAELNLLRAIRVAASPETRDLGVVVVHDNQIWASREISKVSSTSLLPFQSSELGVLGYADLDNRMVIYRLPARKHAPETPFDVLEMSALPRVDIACSYAGADGLLIDSLVAADCRGLVVAGFLPGSATPDQEAALDRARRAGVIVVLCGRGVGRVLERSLLHSRGIVVADNLSPLKARILTMVALTVTTDPEEIQGLFYQY
jgi:L-asparaginase